MNWLALLMVLVSLAAVGCAKKQTADTGSESVGSGEAYGEDGGVGSGAMDSDSNNAMGLQTIHFPYDSSEIVGENREALENNIRIMKDNPNLRVQIEGHCDERGGIQYNLALGERRAGAVKQRMLAAGIAPSRIDTISMGKEKPIAMGSGEDIWAQNRRANFVITSR
jgi:peptidoglycan-associated lipoprotein